MNDPVSPPDDDESRSDIRQRLAADLSIINRHIGARLKTRRKALRLSQTILGRSAGISFQQVQKYEHGSNRIGAALLYQLGSVLQVPISYFFDHLPAVDGLSGAGETATRAIGRTVCDLPAPVQTQIMNLVLAISEDL